MKNMYEIIRDLSNFETNFDRGNYVKNLAKTVANLKNYSLIEFNNEAKERHGNMNFYLDSKKENVILLTAHYDAAITNILTGKICPGANDNSSGVGVLFSLAEKVKGLPIDFAFFGGEEKSLIGSKYHVDLIKKGKIKKPTRVINVDSVGIGENVVIPHCSTRLDETHYTSNLMNKILESNFRKIHRAVKKMQYNTSSDHTPFIKNGISSSMVTGSGFFDYIEKAHTNLDTINTIDKSFLDDILLGLSLSLEELSKISQIKKKEYYQKK